MIPREVVGLMGRRRLVAEVRTETARQALGVVDALAAGGVTTIEVSLTIPGAQEILSHLAIRQDVLVGAGAVLDARQAQEAISCGARFIASPIFQPELIASCRDANVACVLGALTPTEIIAAQKAGAEMVKLFPAEAMGGPAYVRALLTQLTHMSLQISGGFSPQNLGEYLELPVRTVALGALLIPRILVERSNWQALTNRARAFVEFAANPHAYAAQFLAMMGVARAEVPTERPGSGVLAPMGGPPTPAPLTPGSLASGTPASAAFNGESSGSFKPWDSRPVRMGDEEDWLR